MSKFTDTRTLQVQAHIADYETMMERISWSMSLQFMPLVPLVGFYSFIAVASKLLTPPFRIWGAVIATQVAINIYYFALHGVYNHVLYIETKLKPCVADIIQLKTNSFWGWERHIKRFGRANDPLIGDIAPGALSVVALAAGVIIAIAQTSASLWICLGGVVSILLACGSIILAARVVKIRKKFEEVL